MAYLIFYLGELKRMSVILIRLAKRSPAKANLENEIHNQ